MVKCCKYSLFFLNLSFYMKKKLVVDKGNIHYISFQYVFIFMKMRLLRHYLTQDSKINGWLVLSPTIVPNFWKFSRPAFLLMLHFFAEESQDLQLLNRYPEIKSVAIVSCSGTPFFFCDNDKSAKESQTVRQHVREGSGTKV